jgi:predicted DNA-binding transcriptional regulator AlpA
MLSLPTAFQDRLTLSISETAAMLGVASKTLYNQISAGSCPIPTLKVGGRRMVRVSDLLQLTQEGSPLAPPGRQSTRKRSHG